MFQCSKRLRVFLCRPVGASIIANPVYRGLTRRLLYFGPSGLFSRPSRWLDRATHQINFQDFKYSGAGGGGQVCKKKLTGRVVLSTMRVRGKYVAPVGACIIASSGYRRLKPPAIVFWPFGPFQLPAEAGVPYKDSEWPVII